MSMVICLLGWVWIWGRSQGSATQAISGGRGGAGRRSSGVKAAAVLGGPDAERAQEGAAHRLGGAEAAGLGNCRPPPRGVLPGAPGGPGKPAPDIAGRGGAGPGPKGAGGGERGPGGRVGG